MYRFDVRSTKHTQFINIDSTVQGAVGESGVKRGVCHVFVPHTTAAVTINENADPDVVHDITEILERMAPWKGSYRHTEGNSAAHVKASLLGSSQTILVENGELVLGTWQSIFFCEFDGPRSRQVWIQVISAK